MSAATIRQFNFKSGLTEEGKNVETAITQEELRTTSINVSQMNIVNLSKFHSKTDRTAIPAVATEMSAALARNSPAKAVRSSSSLLVFCKLLKTELFRRSYCAAD
jgi:hypothetical protein